MITFLSQIDMQTELFDKKGTSTSKMDGSFHVKSTQKNPYPHRFQRKLVLTQCHLRH